MHHFIHQIINVSTFETAVQTARPEVATILATAGKFRALFIFYSQFFKADFKFLRYDMDILKGMSHLRGARAFSFPSLFFSSLLINKPASLVFPWRRVCFMSQFFFARIAIEQVPLSPRSLGIYNAQLASHATFSLCATDKKGQK